MAKIGIHFVIDVSGTPYGKVIMGLVSFNTNLINEILKAFKREFPQLRRSKRKGSKLAKNELKKIIEFLDQRKVRMVSICFNAEDWKYYKSKYGDRAHFKERIFGILYFMLLREIAYTNYKYRVTVCEESFIKIEKVLDTCRRLAKANKYEFDLSTGYAKFDELIRFADYVASAQRKIDAKDLKQFKYYKILNNEISARDIYKAFRLDKRK